MRLWFGDWEHGAEDSHTQLDPLFMSGLCRDVNADGWRSLGWRQPVAWWGAAAVRSFTKAATSMQRVPPEHYSADGKHLCGEPQCYIRQNKRNHSDCNITSITVKTERPTEQPPAVIWFLSAAGSVRGSHWWNSRYCKVLFKILRDTMKLSKVIWTIRVTLNIFYDE